MVVLEAWAHGKPVLMTTECNLPEGFAASAALRIEPNAASIAEALEDLFRATPSALRTMGEGGRELVRDRFTWPKVAAEMKTVYDWVLGSGPKPGCILPS
jgi:poly(glycerol-phosphate) alpha-glucosyltransferase